MHVKKSLFFVPIPGRGLPRSRDTLMKLRIVACIHFKSILCIRIIGIISEIMTKLSYLRGENSTVNKTSKILRSRKK